MTPRSVVIVGAGLAGARAAETLRSEGYDGRIVMIGEEPVAPYERPALSKEFLLGTRDEASLLLRGPDYWDDRAIELMLDSRVVQLDPIGRTVRTRAGAELAFDELVLATGARPRRLPIDLPAGAHELRTLADARALRDDLVPGSHLVVVGGGFVGAEVASTASERDVQVTIVEAATAPVARLLGTAAGLVLAERWRAHGVAVHLRTGVAHIRSDAEGRVRSILLTNGDEVRADAILIGIGVIPATELFPDRPAAHIRPAGDAVGPGHWTAAASDGAAVARAILGLPAPLPQPAYVWSDQFGLRLQVVGTPRPGDPFELDGDADSFAIRYRDDDGSVRAGLFANRPAEAGALRRRLAGRTLALAA